jgi:hypothetical protein
MLAEATEFPAAQRAYKYAYHLFGIPRETPAMANQFTHCTPPELLRST